MVLGGLSSPNSIQCSTHPSTKICAVNSLTSQELEHKPEASQEFLQYDTDLQVPEGTDFFQFAVAGRWQEEVDHTEVRYEKKNRHSLG